MTWIARLNSVKNCHANTSRSPSRYARRSLSGSARSDFRYSGLFFNRYSLSYIEAWMKSYSVGSSSALKSLLIRKRFTRPCHLHHGFVDQKKFGLTYFFDERNDDIKILNSSSDRCVNSSIQMKSNSTHWYWSTSFRFLQYQNFTVDQLWNFMIQRFSCRLYILHGISSIIGWSMFSWISSVVLRRTSQRTFHDNAWFTTSRRIARDFHHHFCHQYKRYFARELKNAIWRSCGFAYISIISSFIVA